MPRAKKIDLAKEAEAANDAGEVEVKITDAILLEMCPKEILAGFKKAKTPAARADYLYEVYHGPLKAHRDAFNDMDAFVSRLKSWFVQEFEGDQKGVTGKAARVEIKDKVVPIAEDWSKVYAYIKKTGSFDILNKAINAKAVQERWDQEKEIPGMGSFRKGSVSLTKVTK